MSKLYRLEYKGQGVYQTDHHPLSKELNIDHSRWTNKNEYASEWKNFRPAIGLDFPLGNFADGWKSGAKNITQLKRWFGKWYNKLTGVELVRYDAEEILEGKSGLQIIGKGLTNRTVLSTL